MALSSGARLGPYEVLSRLGAGGMGEVYRARDPRLGRDVAIKVLPTEFAADLERLRRFEKEARAASALNHPAIVTIHEVGQSDSTSYIVMELVEGATLRAILQDGPLPTRRLLEVAEQVALGLARAHGAGIVHRDLKPENLMVTEDGFVKILDFGLAKLTQPQSEDATNAPTFSAGTDAGVVLGTVAYMSPEQASGKTLDFRSDQFSFGSVLYEMATGRPAFSRMTKPETLTAIIREEPEPISSLAPKTPGPLRWIVERCLAKEPTRRYASTEDLARDLATVREHLAEIGGSGEAEAATGPGGRRVGRRHLLWLLAAAIGLSIGVAVLRWRAPSIPSPRIETSVLPPEDSTFESWLDPVEVSPDGSRLVFGCEGRSLWVRALARPTAQRLVGAEGKLPFWSADGRWVGFFGGGKLRVVDASGGAPRIVCDAPDAVGGTWNEEGVILFAPDGTSPLMRVSAAGGEATPVTRLDPARHEVGHWFPRFLPDGRHFLYLARTNLFVNAGEIFVGSLDSKETKLLVRAKWKARYAPPGYLLASDFWGTLVAQPFDIGRVAVMGAPLPVAEGLFRGNFSVSRTGLLAYQPRVGSKRTVWFDRSGNEIGSIGPRGDHSAVRLSPDGTKVALTTVDPLRGRRVWVYDLSRDAKTLLTPNAGDYFSPVWAPDGRQIAYGSIRDGAFDLVVRSSSGGGAEQRLLHSEAQLDPNDWSPDGKFIVYTKSDPKSDDDDLWVLPLFGDRKPLPFLATKSATETNARFSPDGRWIAYESDLGGQWQVYVLPFPGPGERWQVSTGEAGLPTWRRDGKEIFYRSSDRVLMAAEVTAAGSSFQTAAAKSLFKAPSFGDFVSLENFDVSADGRFLIIAPDRNPRTETITLVQSWATELKQ